MLFVALGEVGLSVVGDVGVGTHLFGGFYLAGSVALHAHSVGHGVGGLTSLEGSESAEVFLYGSPHQSAEILKKNCSFVSR